MFNFFHTFTPNPIFLKLGPFSIHWYGLLMVIGGLIGLWLVMKLAPKRNLNPKIISDLFLWFIIGAVLGARIYYVIYAWEFYQDDRLGILKIWEGGLAVHGIMLGGFSGLFIFSKLKKIKFFSLADLSVIGLVTAQIIGRSGNYFNQEIFGRPTSAPWGIPIELVNRPLEFIEATHFHPVFLYEVFGNLLILGLLLLVFFQFKKAQSWPGFLFFLYLALYSVQRFFLEYLRVDYSPLLFGARWAQLLSVFIIAISLSSLFIIIYKNQRPA